MNYWANGNAAAVGDFNGDGNLDLAMSSGANYLLVLPGTGNGAFIQPAMSTVFPNVEIGLTSVVTADFNHDGYPDLAITDSRFTIVSILLGAAGGGFQPAATYNAPEAYAAAVADVNGDGNPDLILAGDSGASVMPGNGSGGFGTAVSYPAGPSARAVAIADFDGDRQSSDLAIVNRVKSGTVSILFGNGNGTFQAPVTYAVGSEPSAVVGADFNGDGSVDLAVTNHASGTVSILLNRGKGVFGAAIDYAVGAWPESLVGVDLNGDSKTRSRRRQRRFRQHIHPLR